MCCFCKINRKRSVSIRCNQSWLYVSSSLADMAADIDPDACAFDKYSIQMDFRDHACRRFCGVVVITSALHADGREFEPRQNLSLHCFIGGSYRTKQIIALIALGTNAVLFIWLNLKMRLGGETFRYAVAVSSFFKKTLWTLQIVNSHVWFN